MNNQESNKKLKKTQNNSQQSKKIVSLNKVVNKSPSIHNIMEKDRNLKLNQKIKELFKSQKYIKFTINFFTSDLIKIKYLKDERIFVLIQQIQKWNKEIDESKLFRNKKCEFIRNKFIYNELKKIITTKQIGTQSYEMSLNKIHDFYLKNTTNTFNQLCSIKKKSKQDYDDGWKIRKTFRTNNSLEINNYVRKLLYTESDDLQITKNILQLNLGNQKDNNTKPFNNNTNLYQFDQNYMKNIINIVVQRQNQGRNLQKRISRQKQEIIQQTANIKAQKSRLQGQSIKRNMIQAKKTDYKTQDQSNIFFDKKNKTLNKSRPESSRNQNLTQKQNQQNGFNKIKKYRLQHYLARQNNFKSNLFKNQIDAKSTKSFFTSRDTNSELKFKQHNMTMNMNTIAKDYQKDFYIQFSEIKNWGGQGLMSAPIEKKLKKISKK